MPDKTNQSHGWANEARKLYKKCPLLITAIAVLVLSACASKAPAPQPSLSGEPEAVAVTCEKEHPCESTLKQRYQYYLGMWTAIFLN